MNLIEQLNNIDIKDIKWEDIKQKLADRIDISINIIFVLITIVVFVFVLTSDKKQKGELQAEITLLKERAELLAEKKVIDQKKKDFLNKFPEILPREQLASKISEFATDYNIEVTSYSPAHEVSDDHKITTNINIKITSNNFKNIILFIKALERSPYSMRVNRWEGRSSREFMTKRRRGSSQNDELISVNVEIASTELKVNAPAQTAD